MVPWAQVPKIFESQTIISLGCIQLKSVTSLASGGTYGHQITDISAKTSSVHQSGFFSPIFNRYLHVTKTPNKKFIRCQTIPERFQECILTNAFHLCCSQCTLLSLPKHDGVNTTWNTDCKWKQKMLPAPNSCFSPSNSAFIFMYLFMIIRQTSLMRKDGNINESAPVLSTSRCIV